MFGFAAYVIFFLFFLFLYFFFLFRPGIVLYHWCGAAEHWNVKIIWWKVPDRFTLVRVQGSFGFRFASKLLRISLIYSFYVNNKISHRIIQRLVRKFVITILVVLAVELITKLCSSTLAWHRTWALRMALIVPPIIMPPIRRGEHFFIAFRWMVNLIWINRKLRPVIMGYPAPHMPMMLSMHLGKWFIFLWWNVKGSIISSFF